MPYLYHKPLVLHSFRARSGRADSPPRHPLSQRVPAQGRGRRGLMRSCAPRDVRSHYAQGLSAMRDLFLQPLSILRIPKPNIPIPLNAVDRRPTRPFYIVRTGTRHTVFIMLQTDGSSDCKPIKSSSEAPQHVSKARTRSTRTSKAHSNFASIFKERTPSWRRRKFTKTPSKDTHHSSQVRARCTRTSMNLSRISSFIERRGTVCNTDGSSELKPTQTTSKDTPHTSRVRTHFINLFSRPHSSTNTDGCSDCKPTKPPSENTQHSSKARSRFARLFKRSNTSSSTTDAVVNSDEITEDKSPMRLLSPRATEYIMPNTPRSKKRTFSLKSRLSTRKSKSKSSSLKSRLSRTPSPILFLDAEPQLGEPDVVSSEGRGHVPVTDSPRPGTADGMSRQGTGRDDVRSGGSHIPVTDAPYACIERLDMSTVGTAYPAREAAFTSHPVFALDVESEEKFVTPQE
jgi:hypothetical protein